MVKSNYKFMVGQRVFVFPDSYIFDTNIRFNSKTMSQFCGRFSTIINRGYFAGRPCYCLEASQYDFIWDESWLSNDIIDIKDIIKKYGAHTTLCILAEKNVL